MIARRARSQSYVKISMLSIVCEWKVPRVQIYDLLSVRPLSSKLSATLCMIQFESGQLALPSLIALVPGSGKIL
jgi:hypothetical protein